MCKRRDRHVARGNQGCRPGMRARHIWRRANSELSKHLIDRVRTCEFCRICELWADRGKVGGETPSNLPPLSLRETGDPPCSTTGHTRGTLTTDRTIEKKTTRLLRFRQNLQKAGTLNFQAHRPSTQPLPEYNYQNLPPKSSTNATCLLSQQSTTQIPTHSPLRPHLSTQQQPPFS